MFILCKLCALTIYFAITSLPRGAKSNHIKWSFGQRPLLPMRRQADAFPSAMDVKDDNKKEVVTRPHLQRDYKVENCDNIAYYCFKGYDTGRVCARHHVQQNNKDYWTPRYLTMQNYCQMDYLNCAEGFDVWEVSHLGACLIDKPFTFNLIGEYYEYHDDVFLDNIYVIRE